MQKTILVTGGLGYIGSHISLFLLQKNCNVVILDLAGDTELGKNVAQRLQHNAVQLNAADKLHIITGDMADQKLTDTIFKEHQINAIMHCAAYSVVQESFTNPQKYYINNVTGTRNLVDVALRYNVDKLIFSSSCAVYGAPQETPISEACDFKPVNPYGRTKAMVEWLLSDYVRVFTLRYVSLRYFNAAGAMPEYNLGELHEPETHLIPVALHAALTQKPFTIYGTDHATIDGTCVRDFLHVWDIAQAHWQALEYLENKGKTVVLNLGTGTGTSVKQVLDEIEAITKQKIARVNAPVREGDPAILVADATQAQQILNWRPQYSDIKNIIESTYKFI